MPAHVFTVLCKLNSELYLVGGPVRDSLLARPCHDWDFVCRKARLVARRAARSLRAKFITLDEQNRIYRVILPSSGLRHPPYVRGTQHCPLPLGRGGSEAEGEGPLTLDFAELQGQSIEADLARRDFTVNAMAMRLTPSLSHRERVPEGRVRPIIDPFGGQRDLKKKIIRAVSKRSFPEDPLRLVRAFRFAAQFGFRIEPQTLRWIQRDSDHLMESAAERIREEFLKLLSQPNAAPVLGAMDKAGLLTVLFPDLETCRRTAIRYYGKGGVLKHSLDTVANLEWLFGHLETPFIRHHAPSLRSYLRQTIGGFPRQAWLKFAGLLHDIGKPATAQMMKGRLRFFGHEDVGARMANRILRGLRCSRTEIQCTSAWVQNHMRPGNLAAAKRITDKAVARFFRDLGEDGVGMLLVSLGDHYGYLARTRWGRGTDPVEKITRRMLDSYYLRRDDVLPPRIVNGHVLMKKLRLKPGPLIGRLLEKIQDAQAEGKVKTPEEAIAFAKSSVVRVKSSEKRRPHHR